MEIRTEVSQAVPSLLPQHTVSSMRTGAQGEEWIQLGAGRFDFHCVCGDCITDMPTGVDIEKSALFNHLSYAEESALEED